MRNERIFGLVAVMATGSLAYGQPIVVERSSPSVDRWNYPFNATPGFRTVASTFAAVGFPDFDDMDAQFVIGFDTGGDVPIGLNPRRYSITQAEVTVTTMSGGVFRFDPTSDPFESFLPGADPDFIADADTGRPLELFGVGFRNGFSADTWQENSPFQQAPFGFWNRTRNAFATDFFGGSPRDVSNFVRDRIDAGAFAVGQASVTPGAFVPANTEFTFTIDLSNADALMYVREALSGGRLLLTVASLHQAPTEGSGPQTWPDYFTKENKFAEAFGFAPTLRLVVEIRPAADLNGDGAVDGTDLLILLNQFGGAGSADINNDGVVDGTDLLLLLNEFGT